MLRTLTVLLTLVSLATPFYSGCSRETGKKKVQEEQSVEPVAPPITIEGTPWEKVVAIQNELAAMFDVKSVTALEPEMTLLRIKEWKKSRIADFKKACKEAHGFQQEEPDKRLIIWTNANRHWQEAIRRMDSGVSRWNAHVERITPPEPEIPDTMDVVEDLKPGVVENPGPHPWRQADRHELDVIIHEFTCRY